METKIDKNENEFNKSSFEKNTNSESDTESGNLYKQDDKYTSLQNKSTNYKTDVKNTNVIPNKKIIKDDNEVDVKDDVKDDVEDEVDVKDEVEDEVGNENEDEVGNENEDDVKDVVENEDEDEDDVKDVVENEDEVGNENEDYVKDDVENEDDVKDENENEVENKDEVENDVKDFENQFIINNFKNQKISDLVKEKYNTLDNLLKNIIKCYKNIFKPLNISKMDSDMVKFYSDFKLPSYLNKFKQDIKNKLVYINSFLDYCFIYYVHFSDDSAPFYKLPFSFSKFMMIVSFLQYNNVYINDIFRIIINNDFLSKNHDIEYPLLLDTKLSVIGIEKKIQTEFKPLFKFLLENILNLKEL